MNVLRRIRQDRPLSAALAGLMLGIILLGWAVLIPSTRTHHHLTKKDANVECIRMGTLGAEDAISDKDGRHMRYPCINSGIEVPVEQVF